MKKITQNDAAKELGLFDPDGHKIDLNVKSLNDYFGFDLASYEREEARRALKTCEPGWGRIKRGDIYSTLWDCPFPVVFPTYDVHSSWGELVMLLPEVGDNDLLGLAQAKPEQMLIQAEDGSDFGIFWSWAIKSGQQLRLNMHTLGPEFILGPEALGYGVLFVNKNVAVYASHRLGFNQMRKVDEKLKSDTRSVVRALENNTAAARVNIGNTRREVVCDSENIIWPKHYLFKPS